MRFSLAGNAGERGYQAQIERAVEAEELGYDGIFFSESLMSGLDPFQVLTAAALRTRRIKLGTAIMTMTFREPLVLANQAATLNEISQGRAILGLGTGDGTTYTLA
ncbi:MAG TPA: LLM class flavin-dependent oxidoreductase, partial [Candidatus Binatia bacterium]|nr:LLM class flavin-dependent oxidoreductase [Candidatus Binatia bacterium]